MVHGKPALLQEVYTRSMYLFQKKDYVMTLTRYTKNLRVERGKIFSYNTHVATINVMDKVVYVHGWWSTTTSKHINYVARILEYKTIPLEIKN